MDNILVVHPRDNVGIALKAIAAGEAVVARGKEMFAVEEAIPASHKVALRDIGEGEEVIKYGETIAVSSRAIQRGQWVHTHNLASGIWKR